MMKKVVLILVAGFVAITLHAQPTFDLGLKGGANFSKISIDLEDYSSATVVKTHIGAFARVGWDRVFLQPEVYFSGKGGDLEYSDATNFVTSFDYSTVDVPVLLGLKIVKEEAFGLHVVAGPVFSGITTKNVDNEAVFDEDFYEKHYFGVQYGVGIDVLFLTIDARMENGLNKFYRNQWSSDMKNNTFMLSVGFKIF